MFTLYNRGKWLSEVKSAERKKNHKNLQPGLDLRSSDLSLWFNSCFISLFTTKKTTRKSSHFDFFFFDIMTVQVVLVSKLDSTLYNTERGFPSIKIHSRWFFFPVPHQSDQDNCGVCKFGAHVQNSFFSFRPDIIIIIVLVRTVKGRSLPFLH